MPRVYHAPGIYTVDKTNQVLKAGSSVKLSEAEAMRFVSRTTTVPVPRVHESYILGRNGYIFMDHVPGRPLSHVWEHLSTVHRSSLVSQLRHIVQEWGSLRGDFFGALWEKPSKDVFFIHLPFKNVEISYGPFRNRQEYNKGLIDALHNSRPEGILDDLDQHVAEQLLRLTDNTKVFSHGDLHPGNILVDEQINRITGIVDWEGAGFSVGGREYFEAKSRARDPAWSTALDEIFDEDERKHYELFKQLNQALTRYTCV
ncbi:kinase-like protein [Teratosphaeria nubilosa]|uniref:Kinase-like protein n=1 Tax=Teratosphaeria nubilosa TaxID=161662 RepID=A0A6G1KXY8_9PEZI|nr:kinase-like protein [Teratosphaeria nubilosa]